MRMGGLEHAKAVEVLETALDRGIDFFDHADIYGGGTCEKVFAKALADTGCERSDIYLQSKCGIRDGYYDFSKRHILSSVDGSLKRLRTDYLDVLLLHRPDALVDPEEVAAAFTELSDSGKVRHFGVSNHNPMQIELLKSCLEQTLIVNQMELSVLHTPMISQGVAVNTMDDGAVNRDGGLLDYCRLHGITVQPWSPMARGDFADADKHPELAREIHDLADEKGVSANAVALAWLLRHPAGMQPVIGSMNPGRIRDMCAACEVDLDRPEWYAVYRAAGNRVP